MIVHSVLLKKTTAIAKKNIQDGVRYFSGSHLRLLGLVAAFPLFSMVTAFAVSTQAEQDLKPITVRKVIERLASPSAPALDLKTHYWREEFVQQGDTLGRLFNRLGVNGKEAQAFIAKNPISKDLLKLRRGQAINVLVNDGGELFAVQFLNDDENGEKILIAIQKNNNEWVASSDPVDTQTLQSIRSVTVKTSARGSLAQAGIPGDIRAALNEVFADQFNLNQLNTGDHIRLIYESLYFRGQEIATGNILAAEITHNGMLHKAYYFDHGDNTGTYYDQNGKAINKGFEVTPVGNVRVSSPYGVRVHPISRTFKMHNGIDYVAPSGTPILAPSDGIVVEQGVKGGYGNTVVLRHRGGIETYFAHMSRFQTGLELGQTVTAGKIIGYVGSTGRSTGPHLHYEVRINDQPVDPSTVALPARILSKSELASFKRNYSVVDAQLASIRSLTMMIAQID